jgi:hypothetical protein
MSPAFFFTLGAGTERTITGSRGAEGAETTGRAETTGLRSRGEFINKARA